MQAKKLVVSEYEGTRFIEGPLSFAPCPHCARIRLISVAASSVAACFLFGLIASILSGVRIAVGTMRVVFVGSLAIGATYGEAAGECVFGGRRHGQKLQKQQSGQHKFTQTMFWTTLVQSGGPCRKLFVQSRLDSYPVLPCASRRCCSWL